MLNSFGEENELAITGERLGTRVDSDDVIGNLLEEVRTVVPCLPEQRGAPSLYAANSARLYRDCSKLEIATGECLNPWDSVLAALGSRRIVETAAARLQEKHQDVDNVTVHLCNVDYSGSGATWGCHQSCSHRKPLTPDAIDHLIAFLVSRIPLTGAGGFDNRSPAIEFLISPRSCQIQKTISHESTYDRGVFHTKQEPLARGSLRCHILFAENLQCHRQLWLRAGCFALLIGMADSGLFESSGLTLASPLEAMRRISHDTRCKERVVLRTGERLTAVQIQRRFLETAEARLGSRFMPRWAEVICTGWRGLLDRLETGAPYLVSRELDWAVKYPVFQRQAERAGVPWDSLSFWNPILREVGRALAQEQSTGVRINIESVLGAKCAVPGTVRLLTPALRERKFNWDDFENVIRLRDRLCEVDMKFGVLNDQSIFRNLERQGYLDHGVPRIDAESIGKAMTTPPSGGRAEIRGQVVKRYAGSGNDIHCGWDRIVDRTSRRILDLGDPLCAAESWRDMTELEQRSFHVQPPPGPNTTAEPAVRPHREAMYRRILESLRQEG